MEAKIINMLSDPLKKQLMIGNINILKCNEHYFNIFIN